MSAPFRRPLLLDLLLLLMAGLWKTPVVRAANPCELKGCPAPKPGFINVHILSHSHNDAGWLHTVNAYYDHFVRDIYTSTTNALSENPSRRYVSAENVFFARWWQEQSADVRKAVRDLVQSGQLQFVGGGWTQNDEAVTHYTAIIDQMTLGLRFLNETFGPQCGVPSAAWQADPFGHSVAQAALFARMGFSSVMLGRISYDQKAAWQKNRTMEFIWEADDRQQGGDGEPILAWVPDGKYVAPSPLCFDPLSCSFPGEGMPTEDEGAAFIRDYARAQAKVYPNYTVHVMAGGDLAYTWAKFRFEKQDAVIDLVNNMPSTELNQLPVYVTYSTPACYIEALYAASRAWPRFSGDLLPYTEPANATWAGFYTTRPNLKMMVRYANGFLQASKQLNALGRQNTSIDNVRKLGEAVATLQHHDAITGTCTQNVAKDYANILYEGIKACERAIAEGLVSLLDPAIPAVSDVAKDFRFCHLLNQSDCPPTQRERKFTVLVYNPASVAVSPYIRLPLNGYDDPIFKVKGPGGAAVVSQVVPLASHRHGIPESPGDAAWSLVFQSNVPPLGATLYRVATAAAEAHKPSSFKKTDKPTVIFIENERYRVDLDPKTGLVSSVTLKKSKVCVKLRQTFAAYLYHGYHPSNGTLSPGHYVFSAYREPVDITDSVLHHVVKGPVVQEIHQIFTEYASQVVSLHKHSPFIEFTWTMGPLTKLLDELRREMSGADVISQFETNLTTEGFYTDSNGWRDVRRVTEENSPIASSYYPVTSWIYVSDRGRKLQMMVLPDRPQGGTSLRSGHLELMVHRRHSTNDELGLEETLEELGEDGEGLVARGTHRMFLGSALESQRLMRPQALQLVYRPVLAFPPIRWRPKFESFSGLRSPLPSTLHVLTLDRPSRSQVLLRLEHLATNKTDQEVDVTNLLSGYRLKNIRPVTLGANQFLPGPTRHRWRVQEAGDEAGQEDVVRLNSPEMRSTPDTAGSMVKLHPGQIATFLADLVTN